MYKNFWNDVVLLNLNKFENIGIDFYINIFLFVLALVICIFGVFLEFSRGVMFTTVKQLLRHEAFNKDSAKTLSELGLSKSKFVARAFTSTSRLKKLVHRVGEIQISYDDYIKLDKKKRRELDRIDFENERFYISDENIDTAKRIYSTYNVSVLRIVLFCVLVFILYFAFAAVSSELLCFINSKLS